MKKIISASVMCVKNLLNLEHDIKELEDLGIDMLHLDAMDGHFVNNITFGPDIFNAIHRYTKLSCDYHLMLSNPLPFIERLELSEGDMVTIHAEINKDNFNEAFSYLVSLKKRGVKIGVAINPETSIEGFSDYELSNTDVILVMLINPGFAGQPIIRGILNKPSYVHNYLDSLGYNNIDVSVDGGVSIDRAKKLSKDGVNIFVGGTSGLFRKDMSLEKSVKQLRDSIKLVE